MVAYPVPRGKAGCGIKPQRAVLLARQSENQQKRAVQLFGRVRIDAANNLPNAIAAERHQFICHDL